MPKGNGANSSKMIAGAIESDVAHVKQVKATKAKAKVVKSALKKAEKPKKVEKVVNITIKVPESHRLHWQLETKKDGMTMTSAITAALTKKYGSPD